MNYEFVPMNLEYVKKIEKWKYNGFLKEIYVKPYFDNYDKDSKVLKGPGGCDGFAVLNQDKLIGLFEYYFKEEIMEIGLAISPDIVGEGYGEEFVRKGIEFGINNYDYKKEYIQLSVNIKNKPAIRVYEKAGFVHHNNEEDSIEMRKYL